MTKFYGHLTRMNEIGKDNLQLNYKDTGNKKKELHTIHGGSRG